MGKQVILVSKLKNNKKIVGYRCKIQGKDKILTIDNVKELIKCGVIKDVSIKVVRGTEQIVDYGRLKEEDVVEGVNHMLARRYMEKQRLLGINQLELKLLKGDKVELVKVNDIPGVLNLELPSFITNIRNGGNIRGAIYSAFSGTHYERIVINSGCKVNGNWLFYRLSSKRVQVVMVSKSLDSMEYMFCDCSNLKYVDISGVDTSRVVSMRHLFDSCINLMGVNFAGIDMSKVRNMSDMFAGCRGLKEIDMSILDTSSVSYMRSMFEDCISLNKIDISMLNTSKVVDMNSMFKGCKMLEVVILRGIDTSKVKDMGNMFNGCSKIRSIDLTGLDTSNVRDMEDMFNGCRMLEVLDISKLDTRKVMYMEKMFNGCVSLKELNLSGLMLGSVKQILGMFNMCFKLEKIDLSSFNFSNLTCSDISFIDIFNGCINLKVIKRPYNGILNDVPKGVKLV